MIVKMKKISLVTLSSEIEETISNLRKVGVVHVEHRDVKSSGLDDLASRKSLAEKALSIIPEDETEEIPIVQPDADIVISRALEIQAERRDRQEETERLSREFERYESWGEFDPSDLEELARKGVAIRLYSLQKDQFEEIHERSDAYVIKKGKSSVNIAVVNGDIDDYPAMPVPPLSLSSIAGLIQEHAAKTVALDEELAGFSSLRQAIEDKIAVLEQEIGFERAKLSMENAGELSHLEGYVPVPKIDLLKKAAGKHAWALFIRDPDEEDAVPVLLENIKPVRIISPMFDLLGALPGYGEYDISFWFLMFFSLFFAMIIGDAGYGFVFLSLTGVTALHRKIKGKAAGRELVLLSVLSIATIAWGALSGTWFGSQVIAEAVPFRYLVVEPISTFNPRSSETVKYLCFIIGTAQIVLAHGWNFFRQIREKPWIKAIGQLGWMVLMFGVFFLVLNLVLDPIAYPVPAFALYCIIGGLALVVLFCGQEGNFFKGILRGLTGLFSTFLDSISAFADVISYIRLFAVGLATVEIAKSFNAMASDMGNSVVGIIGGILVLAIGHGINIAMGALSVIVHGVRLNMLEFSGHLNMEWTGVSYTPFSERSSEDREKQAVS